MKDMTASEFARMGGLARSPRGPDAPATPTKGRKRKEMTVSEMGQKGGAARSEAKRAAAKANGKLGGRPRKLPSPPGGW